MLIWQYGNQLEGPSAGFKLRPWANQRWLNLKRFFQFGLILKKEERQITARNFSNWCLFHLLVQKCFDHAQCFLKTVKNIEHGQNVSNLTIFKTSRWITAERKLERLQFSTSSSFFKIWSACGCEFKAYFWTFWAVCHLFFDLETIGVN